MLRSALQVCKLPNIQRYDDIIYLLTAIWLSPGGSSTHLHTNNT